MVNLSHANGWGTTYLHMIEPPAVSDGQTVAMGRQIGRVGSTGDSSAPHLHYQQWADSPTNTERAEFNGVPVNVSVGQSETLASQNCGRGASLNGDRRSDVVQKSADGTVGAFYNSGLTAAKTINWDYPNDGTGAGHVIGVGWALPNDAYYFADLDGNGRKDMIRKNGGTLEAYYNTGPAGKGIAWDYPGATGYVIGTGWGVPDDAVYFV